MDRKINWSKIRQFTWQLFCANFLLGNFFPSHPYNLDKFYTSLTLSQIGLIIAVDDQKQASKILQGVPIFDSQGLKFTTSQLQKIRFISGKEALDLRGNDLNTAEDLTDLVTRVRHFVHTNGKSMNPYTSDQSVLMEAVDYVATAVRAGGEYSSNDEVRKQVAMAAGKSDPNQLTVEDFKKANKVFSDILILYGMDRETVQSGKFHGDLTKIFGGWVYQRFFKNE